jgi:hypothetical protein
MRGTPTSAGDALQLARRVLAAVDQHTGAALGHHLVVGDRQRDDRKARGRELRARAAPSSVLNAMV